MYIVQVHRHGLLIRMNSLGLKPVAKFIVTEWGQGGIKLAPAQGCRTGPPGYLGWHAVTTTLCRSQLYLPFRDFEFGYTGCMG
jgi:hypothetical protein